MIYIVLIFLLFVTQTSFCLEKRITINIEPLREDCFFQTLQADDNLQFEYQVIDGGHGDLDISFNLAEPMGRIMVADFKKSEKSHNVEVKASGDYKFCFDNTFSSFNTKTVYFEIVVYNPFEDRWGTNPDIDFDNGRTDIDIQQIEGLNEIMNTVRSHLSRARVLQDMIKLIEAKDRNIAEETCFKVNTYSMFVLLIMVFVSFVQIFMLKSIFDDKSKMHRILCFLDVDKIISMFK